MTKEEAKELCILKWEYIVNNEGSEDGLINKYPELNKLLYECAYCELYFNDNSKHHCDNCPIKIKYSKRTNKYYGFCLTPDHPYNKWDNANTKENAQVVLDLIKNS